MEVLLKMAISPNGLIARENGEEDWLPEENWHDFCNDAGALQNFVMGRETYELVTELYGQDNFDALDVPYKVIVTKNAEYVAPVGYVVVHSPQKAVAYLENAGIHRMLLIGGGKLNAAFLEAKLVTHIHLIVSPHIIGKGRPFIHPSEFDIPLVFENVEELSAGRVLITYTVS